MKTTLNRIIMADVTSKTEEIKQRLRSEGKVGTIDSKTYEAATRTMNEKMEEVRREYQIKDRQSQISASKVILTA